MHSTMPPVTDGLQPCWEPKESKIHSENFLFDVVDHWITTSYRDKADELSLGGEGWNPSAWATFLLVFLIIQWKTMAMPFSGTFALRLYNYSNHYPCSRPAHVTESWPLAQLQVLQNSGSWMFMSRVKTFSVCDPHWSNSRRRKNYREQLDVHVKS